MVTTVATVVDTAVGRVVATLVFNGVGTGVPGAGWPGARFAAMINPPMNARTTITSSTIERVPGSFDVGTGGTGGGVGEG